MKTQLRVQVAWWFRFYMWGVVTMAMITGLTPDPKKVERVCLRAMRVRLEEVD